MIQPQPDDRSGLADRPTDPLRHHGDVEASAGLLDFAVNVFPEVPPAWLLTALHGAIDDCGRYPDQGTARAAVAGRHGCSPDEVLVVSGAAEAFTLIARLARWRRPAVIHPQFTEPHAALEAAGHAVTTVHCHADEGFVLDPARVPSDADLVMIGNPTNPTGVLHPAEMLKCLRRADRLVVVDEAFMDSVEPPTESLTGDRPGTVLVVRSLTKLWGIPGVRAGYVLADADVVRQLERIQPPWSVATTALAATVACCTPQAEVEAAARIRRIAQWRADLEHRLAERGVHYQPSQAPFVLARLGSHARMCLRDNGIAVRRGDTFVGLSAEWARIAVRPPELTDHLFAALDHLTTIGRPR